MRCKIIDDPGSGHKPVIASITIGSKSMTRKVPTKLSWNFKKADWPRFMNLLKNEHHTIPFNFNQHPGKLCHDIMNTPVATELIRLEERKTYKPGSDQTGRTEDVQAWRQSAVLTQDVQAWRRQSAVLRKAI
ncbi:unnamed protein product [Rodentolepis nana]|uniref:DDE-1 domain-containing protein n=1 Tax=Rodentolepis nana TaxID=102285 RepID=A0A0R3TED7_RODNA|nr:unnamed protein product [Rodentolepis nana]